MSPIGLLSAALLAMLSATKLVDWWTAKSQKKHDVALSLGTNQHSLSLAQQEQIARDRADLYTAAVNERNRTAGMLDACEADRDTLTTDKARLAEEGRILRWQLMQSERGETPSPAPRAPDTPEQ